MQQKVESYPGRDTARAVVVMSDRSTRLKLTTPSQLSIKFKLSQSFSLQVYLLRPTSNRFIGQFLSGVQPDNHLSLTHTLQLHSYRLSAPVKAAPQCVEEVEGHKPFFPLPCMLLNITATTLWMEVITYPRRHTHDADKTFVDGHSAPAGPATISTASIMINKSEICSHINDLRSFTTPS